MVLSKGFFLQCFPEIVTEALVNEFGRPPYPQYIAQHLPLNFLMPLTGSEPVPTVEPMPLPEPEPQESTVEIEWDNPMEPIGFSRSISSASEQPEARAASPTSTIGPTTSLQQLVATRPAPTSETEPRPALTDILTEQNIISHAPTEPLAPLPIVRLCLVPFCLPEQVDVVPPNTVNVASRMALIVDNHSLLYNANGYKISQVSTTVARLHFTLTPEFHF